MAATQGTTGFGTLLKRGNGATTEVFTTIAEVKSISGPQLGAEQAEATHMTSPSGYREYLPTFLTAGTVSFTVNFLPNPSSNHQLLFDDYQARVRRNFTITFPDTAATTWQFAAYVTGLNINAPIDDVLSADVTLTVTGAIDYTP